MERPILIREIDPIIYRDKKRKRTIRVGIYKCPCGNEFEARFSSINAGCTKSCGCMRKDRNNNYRHGFSKTHPLYNLWLGMKYRCYYPKHKSYSSYGGRGIKVCEEWKNSFPAFLRDMGERPEGTTLDRIDPNGDYCPNNCRWATPSEQANNTRFNHFITYNGETKTIAQWAKVLEIKQSKFRARIERGWEIERAMTT